MSDNPIARAYVKINAIYEAMSALTDSFSFIGTVADAPWFVYSDEKPPSYRTEPIPGAVLGGTRRNPEDDVIDEIDRLVDWQLENGKGR